MAKEKENPNHHMGKRTGYELKDGVYHIAPLYAEQFQKLNEEKAGIEEVLEVVTRHATERMKQVVKIRSRIFQDIYDDIGLDSSENWVYSGGKISKQEADK